MKKAIPLSALLIAMLGMTGCDDYVTPAGVVRTAAQAMHEGNLNSFNKVLGGEAKAQYGSRAGMSALNQKLGGFSKLAIEDASQIETTDIHNGTFQVGVRTYSVAVTGFAKDADIFLINSKCIDARGYYDWNCMGDELTECRIIGIK